MALLSGPSSSLETGDRFRINITISHNSASLQDAQDLFFSLEYARDHLMIPNNFAFQFSNGTEGVFSKCMLYQLNKHQ